MIQRVQSLLFFFSAICLVSIVYIFPVLQEPNIDGQEIVPIYYLLIDPSFIYARFFVLFSAALSIFAIFQFRNRKRQKIIASISRLMITIAVFLIIYYSEGRVLSIGAILLIVPFVSLIAANFFINRDDKLVQSADRIR